VIFKSAGLFDWSPDVWVSPERSRSFVAVLSGLVLSSAAIAAMLTALRQAKASKSRFICFLSFEFVSGGITDRNPHAHRLYLVYLLSRDVDYGRG
jgi:hypothetical protein